MSAPVKSLTKIFRDYERKNNKVVVRALNKAAITARNQLIQIISKRYNVTATELRKNIKISKATWSHPEVTLRIKHEDRNIKYYSATQTKPKRSISKTSPSGKGRIVRGGGVKARIVKGKTKELYRSKDDKRGSFLLPNTKFAVIRYDEDKKGPRGGKLKEVTGPSIMQLVKMSSIMDRVERIFFAAYNKNYDHESKRELGG